MKYFIYVLLSVLTFTASTYNVFAAKNTTTFEERRNDTTVQEPYSSFVERQNALKSNTAVTRQHSSRLSQDHYYDNEPDSYDYNCQFIQSASLYRPCKSRYGQSVFDTNVSVGSFSKTRPLETNIVDIEKIDHYRAPIEFTVREGYFNVYRSKYFLPNKTVTREEFVNILLDVLEVDVPENTQTDCFVDLRQVDRTKSKAYQEMSKKRICYAHKKGWLDNRYRFMPNVAITKAAAAKILVTAYDYPTNDTNRTDNYYDDVSETTWFGRFVNHGRKLDIFPDTRRFDPGQTLKRSEAALWFYNLRRARFMPYPGEDTYIDDIKQYTESELSKLINMEREQRNKNQLQFDERLYTLALLNSRSMAENSTLSHGSLKNYLQYLGKDYMSLGENIAVYKITGSDDVSEMVSRIHVSMMNQPSNQKNHRANILGESAAYTHFAVAAYEDKKSGRVWITQIFADKTYPNKLR